jgi:hypothetical protein
MRMHTSKPKAGVCCTCQGGCRRRVRKPDMALQIPSPRAVAGRWQELPGWSLPRSLTQPAQAQMPRGSHLQSGILNTQLHDPSPASMLTAGQAAIESIDRRSLAPRNSDPHGTAAARVQLPLELWLAHELQFLSQFLSWLRSVLPPAVLPLQPRQEAIALLPSWLHSRPPARSPAC